MINHINALKTQPINHPSANNASMKTLVGSDEGWQDYVMRVVDVEVGGYTPKHEHPWPHINYFLEGEGTLLLEDTLHPASSGSYSYVPANTLHQFKNTGDQPFKFICIVPKEGHQT